MNKQKRISRIKTLIARLETGLDVSIRSLSRVLTDKQLETLKSEWKEERLNRKVQKPLAIKKYEAMIKTAIFLCGRGDRMCFLKSPSHKIKAMFQKADRAFEQAIEFINEAIQNDGSLRPWLDRDIKDARCDPIGIPRVIGSSSFECQNKAKVPFLTLSKRQLKIQALETALQELESEPIETPKKMNLLVRKPQKRLNFEEFRF